MVREELVAGLKNAIARGQSLEKAAQSLISAGYPAEEVQDAARNINTSSITLPSISPSQVPTQKTVTPEMQSQTTAQPISMPVEQTPQMPEVKPLPTMIEEKPKSKIKPLWIILGIILLLLVAGLLGIMLFGDKILSALFGK